MFQPSTGEHAMTIQAHQNQAPSMTSGDRYAEALRRASNPQSATNIAKVYNAAKAAGIDSATPGIDVLTFAAWKAKGRCVMKGQKALCFVTTFFDRTVTDKASGTQKTVKMAHEAAVFHVSQTQSLEH
jgi:hypothetical protein